MLMYWHHPYFLFLYPFWPFYLFTKEKKNFRRCLFKIARIHCYWLATIKFGFFYFGTENKSAYLLQKVGTFFFLNTFFLNSKKKKKNNPIFRYIWDKFWWWNDFFYQKSKRAHFLIQNIIPKMYCYYLKKT